MNYITTIQYTRVNETWTNGSVDADPVLYDVSHPLISWLPNNRFTHYQANFYKKIAIDIVAESVYNYPYAYITEKTLRPIACKRLFIIVGPPGVLDLLHKKGFETFSDIIDESYDLITDPVQRWHALENVITNFVTKPIDEIRNIIKSKSIILEKNFITLKNLKSTEIRQLNDTN